MLVILLLSKKTSSSIPQSSYKDLNVVCLSFIINRHSNQIFIYCLSCGVSFDLTLYVSLPCENLCSKTFLGSSSSLLLPC